MKMLFRVILFVSVLTPAHRGVGAETDRYAKVANQFIQLINAGDYSGVEKLFNDGMSKYMPLDKATEFFKEKLTAPYGKIQKLDEPKRNGQWMVFPVHCERGLLDLFLALDDQDKIAGFNFKPHTASIEPPTGSLQTQLSLPFKGRWLVGWGGDTKELNYHHDVPAQRFAFDLLGVNEKGETHRGDGSRNEDYYCFGRDVLAPADGVVVEAIDGVRDNAPSSMNPEQLVGNCVVIQHRTDEFSLLAHLQQGSVVVKRGERVTRGQLLGKCGNSGNSSEPHLHYHLMDGPVMQNAWGIKCVFQEVSVTKDSGSEIRANYSPVKGDIISPVS